MLSSADLNREPAMTRHRILYPVCLLSAALAAGSAAAQQCVEHIKGSQIPGALNTATGKPGYYAPNSAVINDGNGQVYVGDASRTQVKTLMGSSFANATFVLVGGPGSDSNVPGFTCSYDGPRFHHAGKTLQATITIVCTSGNCP
jgi:hypothetical protein